jgi:hypothetical protein
MDPHEVLVHFPVPDHLILSERGDRVQVMRPLEVVRAARAAAAAQTHDDRFAVPARCVVYNMDLDGLLDEMYARFEGDSFMNRKSHGAIYRAIESCIRGTAWRARGPAPDTKA